MSARPADVSPTPVPTPVQNPVPNPVPTRDEGAHR